MSTTAKRNRRQRSSGGAAAGDAATAPSVETALPASKRLKSSHVPSTNSAPVTANKKPEGLGFLVDEDQRAGKKLEARLTNGVQDKRTNRVDDSRAVVASNTAGQDEEVNAVKEVIDISSAEEESSEYDSSEDEDEKDEQPKLNGHAAAEEDSASPDVAAGAEDVEMADGADEAEPEEQGEPSFGDMLATRHPETIDVAAAFPDMNADSRAMVPASNRNAGAFVGTSATTLLQQALKTNDKDSLENVFQTTHLESVRLTIQRLPSTLVGKLLTRLAERIHRRPGRTGHLMVWVQWALVAHGGYLASQPELLRKLKALNLVLRERAQGIQPLLQLKGKLDMLSAQLEFRKASQHTASANEMEDEEGVLYVEGQEEEDFSEEDAVSDEDEPMLALPAPKGSRRPKLELNGTLSDEDDDDEDMPNGIAQEGDEDESADDEDVDGEGEGMFDIEAEESDDGDDASADEDEASESSEEEDVDAADDDESDTSEEPTIKAPRPQKLNRKR